MLFNMILPAAQDTGGTATSFPVSAAVNGYISTTAYKGAIGKGADTPDRSENDYSSASGKYGVVNYYFDFSSVPDTATITEMSIKVKGHKENSDGYAVVGIRTPSASWGGTTTYFSTTTSQVYTLPGISMTVAQLKEAYMEFTVGRDGGLVEGATWTVTYEA